METSIDDNRLAHRSKFRWLHAMLSETFPCRENIIIMMLQKTVENVVAKEIECDYAGRM